jgi:hypothetical protein
MTPEQALQFLSQVLVAKQGLSIADCAGVVTAWNIIANAIQKGKEDGGPGKESNQQNPA